MCDSLCSISVEGSVFAKSSDRPPDEVQLVSVEGARPSGGPLHTQYLDIADPGSTTCLLARPDWLWGAEHGVNRHGVAVGNQRVYTRRDTEATAPALIGMDLVRLGLERATSAPEAVEVIGGLLGEHGQGGVADLDHEEAYFSSFLVADRHEAWVVETEGRSWAAAPVSRQAVVSNRLALTTEWTRASDDVASGTDLDAWRDPAAPTGHADLRLAAGRRFLDSAGIDGGGPTPRQVVAHLRDHGEGPWGEVGSAAPPSPPPGDLQADFTGISVCMHLRRYMATTSSMVLQLPGDEGAPLRCWIAAGSPCVSVFVPAFPPQAAGCAVPAVVGDPGTWRAGAVLRELVEREPGGLVAVRERLGLLEAELWQEADEIAAQPQRWSDAVDAWSARVKEAVRSAARQLGAPGAAHPA